MPVFVAHSSSSRVWFWLRGRRGDPGGSLWGLWEAPLQEITSPPFPLGGGAACSVFLCVSRRGLSWGLGRGAPAGGRALTRGSGCVAGCGDPGSHPDWAPRLLAAPQAREVRRPVEVRPPLCRQLRRRARAAPGPVRGGGGPAQRAQRALGAQPAQPPQQLQLPLPPEPGLQGPRRGHWALRGAASARLLPRRLRLRHLQRPGLPRVRLRRRRHLALGGSRFVLRPGPRGPSLAGALAEPVEEGAGCWRPGRGLPQSRDAVSQRLGRACPSGCSLAHGPESRPAWAARHRSRTLLAAPRRGLGQGRYPHGSAVFGISGNLSFPSRDSSARSSHASQPPVRSEMRHQPRFSRGRARLSVMGLLKDAPLSRDLACGVLAWLGGGGSCAVTAVAQAAAAAQVCSLERALPLEPRALLSGALLSWSLVLLL